MMEKWGVGLFAILLILRVFPIFSVIPKFRLVIPNAERDLKELAGW